MAGERYVRITRQEFDDLMSSLDCECINPDSQRRELVYARMWNDGNYAVKIYSSIVPVRGDARAVGEDAIRVVMFVKTPAGYEPKWKANRVYRTKNWRNAIHTRIEEAMKRGCAGRNFRCKNCGEPMILREGKGGLFYGCSMFGSTDCRYTENFEE
jgi:hypothetical protein